MPHAAAVLDAMLKATGSPVVFGVGGNTYGKLRAEDGVAMDTNGHQVEASRTTLLLREGTQPVPFLDGALLTVGGVSYVLRHVGTLQPDGLRRFTIVERSA